MLMQTFREPICLQLESLEKWVRGELGSVAHERQVVRIASKLFDLTWPLHGLGRAERRLLRMGAMVHDVGRSIDDETHPQEGARMILETAHLPLDPAERRTLAYLTRYHRGKPPEIGSAEILRRSDDAPMLRMLLAILRSADALDGRSLESPHLAFELLGRRLQITCHLQNDTPKARKVYARMKKHRMIEELLGCRVEVRIVPNVELKKAA
jgi:exopolyphosphatase/pppGpp-phosphohydrolase